MTNVELVRGAQLDLLTELKKICEKNNISYFLVGGTLIGAIRHNGFIPWDDDIDVGMFRDQYERFIEACKTDLNPDYALYDWTIDEASPIPFLKMKIKGTHYTEALSKDTAINDEIFIDIFPFDNAPNAFLMQKQQEIQIYLIRKILLLRCGFAIDNGVGWKKLLYNLLESISKLKSVNAWKTLCLSVLKRYNREQTTHVVNMCGAYSYRREMKERYMLEKTVDHEFEKLMVSIPKEYDRYLAEVYGNYMQLPPENERIGRHGVSRIDLGEYKVRYR